MLFPFLMVRVMGSDEAVQAEKYSDFLPSYFTACASRSEDFMSCYPYHREWEEFCSSHSFAVPNRVQEILRLALLHFFEIR